MENKKEILDEKTLNEIEKEITKDDILEETKVDKTLNQDEIDETLDLLEENEIDEEDNEDESIREDEELALENTNENYSEHFDVDEYIRGYNFKEIDKKTFEEFKEEQLAIPEVKEIEKLYQRGFELKGLPTFDDFLKFKKDHNNVYTITIGLPFEYEIFGLEPKIFICKNLTVQDYQEMLEENPNAEKDHDFFSDYIVSKSLLFPEVSMENVKKLEIGVLDILLPAILKNSRFNASYQIIRI